jgi:membrane-bound lytic murein transglycosylase D
MVSGYMRALLASLIFAVSFQLSSPVMAFSDILSDESFKNADVAPKTAASELFTAPQGGSAVDSNAQIPKPGLETASPADPVRGEILQEESEIFPEPAELKPNVDFWMDVYTKYTEKNAIIHDSLDLDIKYEVVDLSELQGRASHRYILRQLSKRKKYYGAILTSLAAKRGNCEGEVECRVAAIFGGTKDRSRYKNAAGNLHVQFGLANRFRDGLINSGQYMEEMRSIFIKNGLPQDLLALPHVESSFNVAAYSRVGAAGIWQFMRSTGKNFMKINSAIDERRDPLLATEGAAKFLKANYSEIGSWPLTVISYNHGKNGIMNAQRLFGNHVDSIIKNYHGDSFGFASRNFYCEFLAARKIMQNPEKYFGAIDLKLPVRYATIKVEGRKTIRQASGYGIHELASLNPALHMQVLRGRRPLPSGYVLRVPDNSVKMEPQYASAPDVGNQDIQAAFQAAVTDQQRHESLQNDPLVPMRSLLKEDTSKPERMQVYVVRRGDTLSTIAGRFRTSVMDIKDNNDLGRNRVRVGQKILIPKRLFDDAERRRIASGGMRTAEAAVAGSVRIIQPVVAVTGNLPGLLQNTQPAVIQLSQLPVYESYKFEEVEGDFGVIRVKSAESLGNYANWAGVDFKELLHLNGWKRNKTISLGQKVKIPLTNVSKDKFEEERIKHHQELLNDFLASFVIDGVDNRVLRRGQTVWEIREGTEDTPIWLMAIYNFDKKLEKVHAGEVIRVPLVHRKLS